MRKRLATLANGTLGLLAVGPIVVAVFALLLGLSALAVRFAYHAFTG